MAVSAGRILILPKGSYDSTTTYEFLDAVYYQGSTYICKKTALNVLPSNTEYWQIMAQGTSSASVAGNYYAECDTPASTPAKVITVPATEYFVLQVGDIVNVKFTYTNTATNPTLNINNTGNKPIVYDTSAITSSNLWAGGEAGRITSFMYDGTNWVWISHDVDTNTLSDLLDTTISSPTNKQGLIFNGTSNKWENADIEGLPSNVITYAQFIQMSDAEQLAFTGYVTDYPGIDDAPTASDTVFDNTGTDLVSNNVNDAIVEVNDKTKRNSVTITKNTSDWTTNNTWVERCGKVVTVHVYLVGIPERKTIATGLPPANDTIYDWTSNMGVITINNTGEIKIYSPATTSSTTDMRTITYIAND